MATSDEKGAAPAGEIAGKSRARAVSLSTTRSCSTSTAKSLDSFDCVSLSDDDENSLRKFMEDTFDPNVMGEWDTADGRQAESSLSHKHQLEALASTTGIQHHCECVATQAEPCSANKEACVGYSSDEGRASRLEAPSPEPLHGGGGEAGESSHAQAGRSRPTGTSPHPGVDRATEGTGEPILPLQGSEKTGSSSAQGPRPFWGEGEARPASKITAALGLGIALCSNHWSKVHGAGIAMQHITGTSSPGELVDFLCCHCQVAKPDAGVVPLMKKGYWNRRRQDISRIIEEASSGRVVANFDPEGHEVKKVEELVRKYVTVHVLHLILLRGWCKDEDMGAYLRHASCAYFTEYAQAMFQHKDTCEAALASDTPEPEFKSPSNWSHRKHIEVRAKEKEIMGKFYNTNWPVTCKPVGGPEAAQGSTAGPNSQAVEQGGTPKEHEETSGRASRPLESQGWGEGTASPPASSKVASSKTVRLHKGGDSKEPARGGGMKRPAEHHFATQAGALPKARLGLDDPHSRVGCDPSKHDAYGIPSACFFTRQGACLSGQVEAQGASNHPIEEVSPAGCLRRSGSGSKACSKACTGSKALAPVSGERASQERGEEWGAKGPAPQGLPLPSGRASSESSRGNESSCSSGASTTASTRVGASTTTATTTTTTTTTTTASPHLGKLHKASVVWWSRPCEPPEGRRFLEEACRAWGDGAMHEFANEKEVPGEIRLEEVPSKSVHDGGNRDLCPGDRLPAFTSRMRHCNIGCHFHIS